MPKNEKNEVLCGIVFYRLVVPFLFGVINKPIETWIDSYICNPAELTCVDFSLEYSNGTNSMFFISMLKKITYIGLKNKKFIVNWYYEDGDEDILEQGEYISSVLDIPFNFIKVCDPLIPEYDSLKWKHPQRVEHWTVIINPLHF